MFERCLYFNVNATARLTTQHWKDAFEPYDLTPAQAYLVRAVLSRPAMSQQQLALELKLEKSTIVRAIDALELKGLVHREVMDSDGREKRILPTGRAKTKQASLERTGDQLFNRMISAIGEDRLRQTVENLRSINEVLEKELTS